MCTSVQNSGQSETSEAETETRDGTIGENPTTHISFPGSKDKDGKTNRVAEVLRDKVKGFGESEFVSVSLDGDWSLIRCLLQDSVDWVGSRQALEFWRELEPRAYFDA